jgi:hypothetical protein
MFANCNTFFYSSGQLMEKVAKRRSPSGKSKRLECSSHLRVRRRKVTTRKNQNLKKVRQGFYSFSPGIWLITFPFIFPKTKLVQGSNFGVKWA